MPIPTFTGLRPDPTFEDLKVKINTLVKELTNLMLNLDKENIVEVDGDVIVSGTVTANALAANSVTADKIQANAVTAGKIDVDELSAISANLGHITAGLIEAVQIFGSYIATSTEFPRAEMSNTEETFAVWASQNKGIKMVSARNGDPFLDFVDSGSTGSIYYGASSGLDILNSGDVQIDAGDIYLKASRNIYVYDWSDFKNYYGDTLQNALDNKLSNSNGAVNMTFDPATRNLKLWSGTGGLLAQVNIP